MADAALVICLEIPPFPDPFAIPLPGGIEIEDVDLLSIIQPALTPLVPIFSVIDAITALFNCVKAIPDALAGTPPDPGAITACLPELQEKISKLLGLIPQVSLPLLVKRLLMLLIQSLQRVREKFLHLQAQLRRILDVIDRARELDDAGLMAIAVCAQGNCGQEARNIGKNLASLGKLLGMIGLFMGLIGGPEIPDLSDLAGRPLDDILPPLDALIQALETARDAVPVP